MSDPWTVFISEVTDQFQIVDAMGDHVTTTLIRNRDYAHLIAAASEMLDALIDLHRSHCDTCCGYGTHDPPCPVATLIAKAEGRTE